jgi:hypothetical protein
VNPSDRLIRTPRPPTTVGGRFRAGPQTPRWRGSASGVALLLGAALVIAGPLQTTPPTASQPADTQPSVAGPQVRLFQPGVWIDWQNRAVLVQTRVVLRRGPLEFLACWPGKEHESILRFEAAAEHVYMALGLLGIQPGQPPAWDDALNDYGPPTGDLVELSCTWQQDGQSHAADACTWLKELDYARPPIPRPWVFAGSIRLPDGTLAAGHSGAGIAVVDFPDSLLSPSRARTSRNSELWVEANAEAIPPQGTPVQLSLRPARTRLMAVMLDFRGEPFVDGRFASLADLADLIRIARQLDPQYIQSVSVVGTLSSDVQRVQRELVSLGVPREAVQFAVEAPAAPARGGGR